MHEKAYLGVYSTRIRDSKGQTQKKLHFVWSDETGGYCVQALDGAYQPVGAQKSVSAVVFKALYSHEPSVLAMPLGGRNNPLSSKAEVIAGSQKPAPDAPTRLTMGTMGAMGAMGKMGTPSAAIRSTPAKAPPPDTDQSDTDPAESPATAPEQIKKTEDYLRGFFEKALKRSKRTGERTAAIEALKTVAEVEEGIVPAHKHMFADFGTSLRQNALLELALGCCKRVLELAPEDDHAHFNAARVLFDMNDLDGAEQHLLTAQSLDASEPVYAKMLDFIQKERRRRFKPQHAQTRGNSKTSRRR